MKLEASTVLVLSVALDAFSSVGASFLGLLCGLKDAESEYPARSLLQVGFAVNMLPQLFVAAFWYLSEPIAGVLALGSLLCTTIHVYVTQLDAKFLSGQSGLMANLFSGLFMLYTSFCMPHATNRRIVAVAYCLNHIFLLHFIGRYLQTGSDNSAVFEFFASSLALVYQLLTMDEFSHSQLEFRWTHGLAQKAGKIV